MAEEAGTELAGVAVQPGQHGLDAVVAAFIAVGGAAVGLLTRRGRRTADAVTAAGPRTEPAAAPLPVAGAEADGHGALTGMVRDGRGAPVAAAAVTIIDGTGAQVAREVTAGDGRYHIGGVRPGVYTALITAADHHPAASMVAFGAPQTRSDFDLSPAPGPA